MKTSSKHFGQAVGP